MARRGQSDVETEDAEVAARGDDDDNDELAEIRRELDAIRATDALAALRQERDAALRKLAKTKHKLKIVDAALYATEQRYERMRDQYEVLVLGEGREISAIQERAAKVRNELSEQIEENAKLRTLLARASC